MGNGADAHWGGGAAECVCLNDEAQGCSLRKSASHRVAAQGQRRNGQARSCHYGINLCAVPEGLRSGFRRAPGELLPGRRVLASVVHLGNLVAAKAN